jgi:hypothetical protein
MVIVVFAALMAHAGQAQYGAWQHSQYIILNTTATGADISGGHIRVSASCQT